MENLIFKDPLWLLALACLPLIAWMRGRRGVLALVVPHAIQWHRPVTIYFSQWPPLLAYAGLVLLVIALARPQKIHDKREVRKEGYDLMLAIDVSGSMLAEDYEQGFRRINRLQAVAPVIEAFIARRTEDRIGLVVFAGRAYTLSPLTFDHEWLQKQAKRLKVGLLEDGTAIGDGLGLALSRLESKSKDAPGTPLARKGAFVILLTDGANNRGALPPLQSAEIAAQRGIPVYTIGAGREGLVPMPIFDESGVRRGSQQVRSDLDENTLRQIANMTGGHYFRAADTGTIQQAFDAIDKQKKIEFQAQSYLISQELYAWFAVPGATALLLSILGLLAPAWRQATSTAQRQKTA